MTDFGGDGFVLLPGLLGGERLERVREAAECEVAAPSGTSCERPNNTLVPLRWNSTVVETMMPAADRIAAAAGARDLRWISGYISVKEPHSPPLWWHQDWWAWDHPISFEDDAAQIAVLCYLSDTTVTTGALRVLPGSQAESVPLHALLPEAHSTESTATDPAHPAMVDQPEQVSFELCAGDAVVTDYRLLHGTHPNRGAHRRDCVLLSFAPHWRELPTDVRAHLISHPALPNPDDGHPTGPAVEYLPHFDGPRRDLVLNRNAPATFTTSGRRSNRGTQERRSWQMSRPLGHR